MAHIVVPVGVTCLGIVVGWLVRYFIRRFKSFGVGGLGSLLSIVVGGAVLKFLSVDNVTIWYYPIGLFVGFVIYQVIVMFLIHGDGTHSGGGNSSSEPRFMISDIAEPRYLVKPPKK